MLIKWGDDELSRKYGIEENEVPVDVCFPPKKTRPLIGKLIKRGRAKFKTAFANELWE